MNNANAASNTILGQDEPLTERFVRDKAWAAHEKLRLRQGADPTTIRAEWNTPKYQEPLEDSIVAVRGARPCLTDRQLSDVRANRALEAGDRVRFIAPTREERSSRTGQPYERPYGQTGTVTSASKNDRGQVQFTFVPDLDEAARARAATTDVELHALVTNKWHEFERL